MISDWFKANKLTLNLDKLVCMLFTKKCNLDHQCLSELGLPVVTNTKFLGVKIDNHLDWTYQFNHIVLKIKRNMRMLQQSVKLFSPYAKKNLYYGHIYSHLSYCIGMWGPSMQQSQIKKLQKLQNKCVNLIDTTRSDLWKIFYNLRILRINEIIDLELIKIGYRLLNKNLPKVLLETIETDHNNKSLQKNHCYAMRHRTAQNLPRVACSKYLNSFLCKSVKLIQPLLFITQQSTNLKDFIRCYKNHLFVTSNNIV